jgi:hypothetical protein
MTMFADPHAIAITSRNVVREGAPILFVARTIADDAWIVLDAEMIDAEDEMASTLDTLLRRDPALRDLADLPPGWQARRRSIDEPWIRYPRCC